VIRINYVSTSIGNIAIAQEDTMITRLFLPGENVPEDAVLDETQLLYQVGRQLREYLAGRRRLFSLPLDPRGTQFMHLVWAELQRIPYGETRTYGHIANAIGNPKACRAVGQASHKNPIPIIIPCHRVIGADGTLVGYGGGLTIKALLLDLEKRTSLKRGCQPR
jgi:methylated-DNA-[protein]-cysteine S-methyltransferase